MSGQAATKRLGIYLNDHLAGSTGGMELARRLRRSNEDDPDYGPQLAEVCAEIEGEREILIAAMEHLGVDRDRIKLVAARLGERLGRLKTNGQLRGYSPLSRLDELELLQVGVAGKRRLWRALEHTRAPTTSRTSTSADWPSRRRVSCDGSRHCTSVQPSRHWGRQTACSSPERPQSGAGGDRRRPLASIFLRCVCASQVSLWRVSLSPVSLSPVSLSPVSLSPVSLSPVSLSRLCGRRASLSRFSLCGRVRF